MAYLLAPLRYAAKHPLLLGDWSLITLLFVMLLNKSPQCLRVGLRPNCAALETSITLSLKLRPMLKSHSQKATCAVRPENDVRKKLLARPSDLPFDDFCPAAFVASSHVVKSPRQYGWR